MGHAGTRSTFAVALSIAAIAAHAAASTPAAAGASGPAAAASAVPSSKPLVDACPAQLAVNQTVVEHLAGWSAVNQQGGHPFVRVAFYPGQPADASLIVPTVEYRGQTGLHDRWDLPRRAGGYWMTCAYGNTSATLTRKLADDVDFCMADYDGRFLTLVVKHWSCGVKRTLAPAAWTRSAAKAVRPASKAANRGAR
jgi:hypothetical protein